MCHEDFDYDGPPTAMLYLSDPPELKLKQPFTDYLIGRAGGEKKLMEFIEALRDFAEKSNFMQFFKDHQEIYQKIINNAKTNFAEADPVKLVEDYFGMQNRSYTLILAPLARGGYGPKVEDQSGNVDIYSILGPNKTIKDIPQFGGNPKNAQVVLWHEFSHSFVNPSTHKFMEQFDRYSSLFEPMKETMENMAYGQWEICINEHIVRTVTFRLAKKVFGEELVLNKIGSEAELGFVYVPALYEKLEDYETHRDKFPTFEDFYPEIIDLFKELSEKELDKEKSS
jgi:hypothetical protein